MNIKNLLFIILFSFSFSQVRMSYELDGKFENNSSDGAFLLGYDHMMFKQKNINSGVGVELSVTESPENMRFNSLYSIVNYNVEETWNLYSKLGLSYCEDNTGILSENTGLFLGVGINYYFKEKFHIELGYHTSYIDGYEHSRFVYSLIKHFEFDND